MKPSDLTPDELVKVYVALHNEIERSSPMWNELKSLLPCVIAGCKRAEGDIICKRCDYALCTVRTSRDIAESPWEFFELCYTALAASLSKKTLRYIAHLVCRHSGVLMSDFKWHVEYKPTKYSFDRNKALHEFATEIKRRLPDECVDASRKIMRDAVQAYSANPAGPFNVADRVVVWHEQFPERKRAAVVHSVPKPPNTHYDVMYAPTGSMPVSVPASCIEYVPHGAWARYYGK